MANHKGSEGSVYIGANAVAELNGWSLDEAAATIDDSNLSDTVTTMQVGRTSWTGSADCFWDETDTNGQEALTIGASVTLNMYPEGNSSTDRYASGTALVTGISMSAAIDGMVTRSFTFQGTGALTWAAVA